MRALKDRLRRALPPYRVLVKSLLIWQEGVVHANTEMPLGTETTNVSPLLRVSWTERGRARGRMTNKAPTFPTIAVL